MAHVDAVIEKHNILSLPCRLGVDRMTAQAPFAAELELARYKAAMPTASEAPRSRLAPTSITLLTILEILCGSGCIRSREPVKHVESGAAAAPARSLPAARSLSAPRLLSAPAPNDTADTFAALNGRCGLIVWRVMRDRQNELWAQRLSGSTPQGEPTMIVQSDAEIEDAAASVGESCLAAAVWLDDGKTFVAASANGTEGWSRPAPAFPEALDEVHGIPHVAVRAHGEILVMAKVNGILLTKSSSAPEPVKVGMGPAFDGAEIETLFAAASDTGDVFMGIEPRGMTGRTFLVARLAASARTWEAPVAVTATSEDTSPETPKLAVGSNGDAVLVWADGDPFVSFFDPREKKWSRPEMIAKARHSTIFPSAAVSRDGAVIVAWGNRRNSKVEVATKSSPTSRWQIQPGFACDDVSESISPTVTINGEGRALVVWDQSLEGAPSRKICYVAQRPVGDWDSVAQLATGGAWTGGLSIGIDGNGRALLAWIQGEGRNIEQGGNTRLFMAFTE